MNRLQVIESRLHKSQRDLQATKERSNSSGKHRKKDALRTGLPPAGQQKEGIHSQKDVGQGHHSSQQQPQHNTSLQLNEFDSTLKTDSSLSHNNIPTTDGNGWDDDCEVEERRLEKDYRGPYRDLDETLDQPLDQTIDGTILGLTNDRTQFYTRFHSKTQFHEGTEYVRNGENVRHGDQMKNMRDLDAIRESLEALESSVSEEIPTNLSGFIASSTSSSSSNANLLNPNSAERRKHERDYTARDGTKDKETSSRDTTTSTKPSDTARDRFQHRLQLGGSSSSTRNLNKITSRIDTGLKDLNRNIERTDRNHGSLNNTGGSLNRTGELRKNITPKRKPSKPDALGDSKQQTSGVGGGGSGDIKIRAGHSKADSKHGSTRPASPSRDSSQGLNSSQGLSLGGSLPREGNSLMGTGNLIGTGALPKKKTSPVGAQVTKLHRFASGAAGVKPSHSKSQSSSCPPGSAPHSGPHSVQNSSPHSVQNSVPNSTPYSVATSSSGNSNVTNGGMYRSNGTNPSVPGVNTSNPSLIGNISQIQSFDRPLQTSTPVDQSHNGQYSSRVHQRSAPLDSVNRSVSSSGVVVASPIDEAITCDDMTQILRSAGSGPKEVECSPHDSSQNAAYPPQNAMYMNQNVMYANQDGFGVNDNGSQQKGFQQSGMQNSRLQPVENTGWQHTGKENTGFPNSGLQHMNNNMTNATNVPQHYNTNTTNLPHTNSQNTNVDTTHYSTCRSNPPHAHYDTGKSSIMSANVWNNVTSNMSDTGNATIYNPNHAGTNMNNAPYNYTGATNLQPHVFSSTPNVIEAGMRSTGIMSSGSICEVGAYSPEYSPSEDATVVVKSPRNQNINQQTGTTKNTSMNDASLSQNLKARTIEPDGLTNGGYSRNLTRNLTTSSQGSSHISSQEGGPGSGPGNHMSSQGSSQNVAQEHGSVGSERGNGDFCEDDFFSTLQAQFTGDQIKVKNASYGSSQLDENGSIGSMSTNGGNNANSSVRMMADNMNPNTGPKFHNKKSSHLCIQTESGNSQIITVSDGPKSDGFKSDGLRPDGNNTRETSLPSIPGACDKSNNAFGDSFGSSHSGMGTNVGGFGNQILGGFTTCNNVNNGFNSNNNAFGNSVTGFTTNALISEPLHTPGSYSHVSQHSGHSTTSHENSSHPASVSSYHNSHHSGHSGLSGHSHLTGNSVRSADSSQQMLKLREKSVEQDEVVIADTPTPQLPSLAITPSAGTHQGTSMAPAFPSYARDIHPRDMYKKQTSEEENFSNMQSHLQSTLKGVHLSQMSIPRGGEMPISRGEISIPREGREQLSSIPHSKDCIPKELKPLNVPERLSPAGHIQTPNCNGNANHIGGSNSLSPAGIVSPAGTGHAGFQSATSHAGFQSATSTSFVANLPTNLQPSLHRVPSTTLQEIKLQKVPTMSLEELPLQKIPLQHGPFQSHLQPVGPFQSHLQPVGPFQSHLQPVLQQPSIPLQPVLSLQSSLPLQQAPLHRVPSMSLQEIKPNQLRTLQRVPSGVQKEVPSPVRKASRTLNSTFGGSQTLNGNATLNDGTPNATFNGNATIGSIKELIKDITANNISANLPTDVVDLNESIKFDDHVQFNSTGGMEFARLPTRPKDSSQNGEEEEDPLSKTIGEPPLTHEPPVGFKSFKKCESYFDEEFNLDLTKGEFHPLSKHHSTGYDPISSSSRDIPRVESPVIRENDTNNASPKRQGTTEIIPRGIFEVDGAEWTEVLPEELEDSDDGLEDGLLGMSDDDVMNPKSGTSTNKSESTSRGLQPPKPRKVMGGKVLRWIRGDSLGAGTGGRAWSALDIKTGKLVCVKRIDLKECTKETRKALKQELESYKTLRHPYIIEYYGHECLKNSLFIYLEYMSGGSLSYTLQVYGALEQPLIAVFTKQLLKGLAYLHSKHIVHRDVKGANILVGADCRVKLSDFGCARVSIWKNKKGVDSSLSSISRSFTMNPQSLNPQNNNLMGGVEQNDNNLTTNEASNEVLNSGQSAGFRAVPNGFSMNFKSGSLANQGATPAASPTESNATSSLGVNLSLHSLGGAINALNAAINGGNGNGRGDAGDIQNPLSHFHFDHSNASSLQNSLSIMSLQNSINSFGSLENLANNAGTNCNNQLSLICQTLTGSVPWMAPEVISGGGYNALADIWSLGCVVLEMGTGLPPWDGKFENNIAAMVKIAMTEELPDIPGEFEPTTVEFVHKCLTRNAKERPNAKALLKHAFVKGKR